jgi:enamine deaminase RidA (YjgF/YER057c/UK114 family)
MTLQRIGVAARYSDAVIHNDLIFLAGHVPENSLGQTIEVQTQDVLDQIDDTLQQCGSDKSKIISATIYLTDMNDFSGMNSVWDKWVVAGHTPARATVQAKLAVTEYRLEIVMVAAR